MTAQIQRLPFTLICSVVMLALVSPGKVMASDPQVIPLWPDEQLHAAPQGGGELTRQRNGNNAWVGNISRPTLTVYFPSDRSSTSAGIVVCPGGGYGGLAITKEGHEVAQWLAEQGVVAGVLKYRCGGGPNQHPVPLSDAQRAIRIFRHHAEQWNVASDQIGILGFSAGGHLASTAGTHVAAGNPAATDPLERDSSQANFMVLVYPVITLQLGVSHGGSRKNLVGENPDAELVKYLSNEQQVDEHTGPAFLVHASDDKAVPVENSLLFYQALHEQGIPAELHVYDRGGHGFGMNRGNRPCDQWHFELRRWLDIHGWLGQSDSSE